MSNVFILCTPADNINELCYIYSMKYLGIDFGSKRIGVALSDIEGRMAFPHSVMQNGSDIVSRMTELCKKEGVDVVIIGESLDRNNKENPIMKKILPFKVALEGALGLPVLFHTEVLTSQEAKLIQGENAMHDASAAAIILQSYIDREADRLLNL